MQQKHMNRNLQMSSKMLIESVKELFPLLKNLERKKRTGKYHLPEVELIN